MNDSTDGLSATELNLLNDPTPLYLKRSATRKLIARLGDCQRALRDSAVVQSAPWPVGTDVTYGKISRGENYRQLPYLVLDYPRLFGRDAVAALRLVCWWGHGIGVTLLLSGERTRAWRERVARRSAAWASGTLVGLHRSPWHHHYGPDNYRPATDFTDEALARHLTEHPFLKLCERLPFADLPTLPERVCDRAERWLD